MPNCIELKDVCKTYQTGEIKVHALDHVNLTVENGEFVAIVGQSGSGKSTLMNLLGCLDTPTSGQYLLGGEDVSHMTDDQLSEIRNRKIGFIFQGFNLIPSLSAAENVELPLLYRGMDKAERKRLSSEALEKVGLSRRIRHQPFQMSGGQQQRVAIARAIAARPPIILADEPTGNLDSHSGSEVLSILRGLHQEGKTIVLITHDSTIAKSADRVIRIQDGKKVDDYKKSQ